MTKAMFVVLTILTIFWLTIGRAFLGSMGWFMLIYIINGIPVISLACGVLISLAPTEMSKKKRRSLNPTLSTLLYVMFAAAFLHGFFLVDFGDTEDSTVSAAATLFGRSFLDVSSYLSLVFLLLTFGLYITAFAYAIHLRTRQRKNK